MREVHCATLFIGVELFGDGLCLQWVCGDIQFVGRHGVAKMCLCTFTQTQYGNRRQTAVGEMLVPKAV